LLWYLKYMTISAPNARIIALGPLRLKFGSTRLAVMSTSNCRSYSTPHRTLDTLSDSLDLHFCSLIRLPTHSPPQILNDSFWGLFRLDVLDTSLTAIHTL
jgi:hypothetical protein